MSDDTPTEAMPTGTAGTDDSAKKNNRRTILIVISVIALILLLAVTVLLTLLLSGLGKTDEQPVPSLEPSASASVEPSESPSASAEPEGQASAEPSESPSPTPPPPPPPPSNDPVISTFKASSSTVSCNSQSPVQFPAYVSFTWATSKVDKVYFGIDTNDASTAPFFDNLPPSGTSQSDFPPGYNNFEYNCYAPNHKYTLTVIGSNGKKVSKSVTVTNVGDTQ